MGNLARKLIDAVQHSLLGSLFSDVVRFVIPVGLLVLHLVPPLAWILFPLVGLLILAGFLAWGIGALANRRPRHISPLHALQLDPPQQPANGFGAWSELPAEGLNPPPIMRWIVTRIGSPPDQRARWLEGTLALAAMGLLFLLSFPGFDFWQTLYPALAAPTDRLLPALACLALLTLLVIRGWASAQRKLLDQPAPGRVQINP